MERRVFLAICLSILVMYLYQVYFLPPQAPPTTRTSESAPASSPAVLPEPSAIAAPAPVTPLDSPEAPEAVLAADREQAVVISTNRLEIELTNRGGRVRRIRLKDYLDDRGQPVDLVPAGAPPQSRTPFSLEVEDPDVTRRLNDALYKVSGDLGGRVDVVTEPAVVTFEYEDAAGLSSRKQFRVDPDSYVVTFDAHVTNGGETLNPVVHWGPGLGDIGAAMAGGSFFTGNYVQPPAAIYHQDGDIERTAAQAFAEEPSVEGEFLFAGIDDHYFLVAVVEPGRARLAYEAITAGTADARLQFASFAARFADGPQQVRYFVGPKELETLRDVHPQMVYTINFGVFKVVVVPLLQALKWLHGYIGNYGWSIIVLTIIINLILAPLRHKSLVSMRKMQMIQPQVKAIQDRYADLKMSDPARQKMSTEVMALYREKGANPAAGCVPMLMTMPVLFSFYSMLSQAIELRGADFGFWIHDLSQKDPYYVTPLMMGATMFWQQWMMPTSADPMQQRMMLIMPVVFTVLFLGFPSGLAIYYLVSNVFQISQQYYTNRVLGPPPAAQPVRSAGERRLKKAPKAS